MFILCVFIHPILCNSQSFVGGGIGIDFAQIREFNPNPRFEDLEIFKNGYSINSLLYGIRGEQWIAESYSLSLQFSYTKKEFKASKPNIVPIEGLRFNFFRSSLSLKCYLIKNIYVAPGFSINYISNVREYFKHGTVNPFPIKNKKEYGGLVSAGLLYKDFLAEIYYNRGFSFQKNKDKVDFRPINSIGLSLSYLFRVSKKKNK